MESKGKIIYSSIMNDNFTMDELRQTVAECNDVSIEEVTENGMWQYWEDEDITNWEAEKEVLKPYFDKNGILLVGTVGLWTGTHLTHKIIESFDDFIDAICNYDDVKIWSENGKTYLNLYHHDGTNRFEIKVLNEEHCQLSIDKNDMYEFEDIGIENLIKPYYSKKIDLRKLFYGA